MILADIILITLTLAALIFATISDLKIKEVPDWLSYSLIASGLSIRLLHSLIFNEFSYFGFGLLGLLIMFLVGNALYHTKQWGGGDAKLLMGIGTTLTTTPFYLKQSLIPFLFIIFSFILLSGAVYGLIYSLYFIFKDFHNFKLEFKKLNKKIKFIKIIAFSGALITFILALLIESPLKIILLILMILLILYPFLYISLKSIENLYLYSYFTIDKLMEGDWITQDIKKNNKIIFHKKISITKNDIKKLNELNVKKVLVKDGIPFVPPFLIGTILALIIGNPLA